MTAVGGTLYGTTDAGRSNVFHNVSAETDGTVVSVQRQGVSVFLE